MATRKKTAPKRKPAPLKITAVMKRARAAVLGGPPDIDAEELAAEIYKVMAAKAPKQRTAIPRRTCAPRATVVSHTHERADCRPWWRLDTSPSPRVKRRSYAPHPS